MTSFARIEDGFVVEILDISGRFILDADGVEAPAALEDLYHPDIVAACHPCSSEVGQGWTYDGQRFAPPPPPPEPPPPPILTLLPMAEFWRRVTDDEAEAVEAAFGQARLRLRRIFEAAEYLDTTDKDYSSLREVIAGAIETERVAEILAPSK